MKKRIGFYLPPVVDNNLVIRIGDVLYKNVQMAGNKRYCAFDDTLSVWMSSILIFVAYSIPFTKQYVLNSM